MASILYILNGFEKKMSELMHYTVNFCVILKDSILLLC